MQPTNNHPRVEFFLSQSIAYLSAHGKRSRDEYYDMIEVFWNEFLDEETKDKILSYKYEKKVIESCAKIYEKYHFLHLAKHPQEIEKVCYAVGGGIDLTYLPIFKKYYDRVLEWFLWELSELNISVQHKKNILKYLKEFQSTPEYKKIFLDILFEVGDLAKMQRFVRAYQSLMNHSYYAFEGKVFSRFSYEIFERYQSFMGKEMKEKEVFFEKVAAGYEHIFEYFIWEKENILSMRKGLQERFQEFGRDITQKEIEYHIPCIAYNSEYVSILRHSYDWYVRLVPQEIEKFSPIKMWAGGLTFLHIIYSACERKYLPKNYQEISLYERNEYMEVGGAKYTYRLGNTADFAFDDLLVEYYYIDPQLFFSRLSESQEEKLMKDWDKIRNTRKDIAYQD